MKPGTTRLVAQARVPSPLGPITLAATDLVTWARLIGFRNDPGLARAEIATFRYRVLHTAARITHGARQLRLRLDATWRWAAAIATAWHHIRTAFE